MYPTDEDNVSVVQYFKFGMKYPQGVYEPFSFEVKGQIGPAHVLFVPLHSETLGAQSSNLYARHYMEKVTACHYTPANEEYFTTALNSLEILHMLNTI